VAITFEIVLVLMTLAVVWFAGYVVYRLFVDGRR
jgi:hypothetical protein